MAENVRWRALRVCESHEGLAGANRGAALVGVLQAKT